MCPVFGLPKEFRKNVLPTYADIIKYYLYLRQELVQQKKQRPSFTDDVCSPLIKDLKNLWQKSSICVVSDQQILHKVREYHSKYRNIMKRLKKDGKVNNSKMVVFFRESAEKKLFDISLCKCKDFLSCSCKDKVPVSEREFLTDQRTSRKMVIGPVDQKATKILEKRLYRKNKTEQRIISQSNIDKSKECEIGRSNRTMTPTLKEETSSSSLLEKNVLIYSENSANSPSTSQMRIKLPSLAQACDRTGVSDRAAAIIVSATLRDMGIVTTEDSSKIVDRSKI